MPDRPKKILYVQPNAEIGGSDIALLRTVACLDRDKYCPIVALPSRGQTASLFEKEGVECHIVPMMQLRTIPSISYHLSYLWHYWPTIKRLARLIESLQVDLVHSNSLYCLYGGWAARRAKVPHIWHIREIPPAVPLARPALAKMVLMLSTRVISMTSACTEGLFGRWDVSEKLACMPAGLDLSQWQAGTSGSKIRSELGIAPETPIVGFVARLDPWKGLDVFIKAAAIIHEKFPEVQFLIVGGAPAGFEAYAEQMQQLAQQLGVADSMIFLGWHYSLESIPQVMAAMNIMSHTSIRPEPFGLVLIEAMAMGRPVVASKAGGPLSIVLDGQTGYLTPPNDAEAHAQALSRLLSDPQLAQDMGQAGRQRVETEFSLEAFRRRLVENYERAFEVWEANK